MKKVVLAFSGGLDTSFCAVYLKEKYNADVITVTVDTGGFTQEELVEIKKRSRMLGAMKHYTIDGKKEVFDRFVTYIVKGNVLRGTVYPLCVAAERVVQAQAIVKIAKEEKATAVAHGSTGAGNDQVRFDVVFHTLAPELEIITPIRDLGISREEEIEFLEKEGVKIPTSTKKYSINKGLLGVTIGGSETHDPWQKIKEDAYSTSPAKAPDREEEIIIGFEKGLPVNLNGIKLDGVSLITRLNEIAVKHGIGRGMHLGDTILGIKGRIGFESPLIILIKAHRELEKLVHTKWQSFWKNWLADFYGSLLHEGLYFDPVMRDIEAMIDSSQEIVTGRVRVKLYKGNTDIIGCESPYSLMNKDIAVYGEKAKLWNGKEAKGFCKIYGMQSILAKKAKELGDKQKHRKNIKGD